MLPLRRKLLNTAGLYVIIGYIDSHGELFANGAKIVLK